MPHRQRIDIANDESSLADRESAERDAGILVAALARYDAFDTYLRDGRVHGKIVVIV